LVPEGVQDPGGGRVVDPRPGRGPGRGQVRLTRPHADIHRHAASATLQSAVRDKGQSRRGGEPCPHERSTSCSRPPGKRLTGETTTSSPGSSTQAGEIPALRKEAPAWRSGTTLSETPRCSSGPRW